MNGTTGGGSSEHPVRTAVLGIVLFVVCVGLGVGGAIVYTGTQPTLYASKSVVQVYSPASLTTQNATKVDPTRLVSIEVTYAQSQDVSDAADKALGADGVTFDHVDWAALKDQDAISVTCFAGRAGDAVRCADGYAAAYIANRTANVPQSLNAAADALQSKIDTTQAQADALGRLVAITDPRTQPAKSKEYAAKQAALLSRITQFTQTVNQDRAQAKALAAAYKVVQPAPTPTGKASPTPSRNLTIGLIGGAVLGIALLLVWQQLATLSRARRRPVVNGAPPAPRHLDAEPEPVNGAGPDAPDLTSTVNSAPTTAATTGATTRRGRRRADRSGR